MGEKAHTRFTISVGRVFMFFASVFALRIYLNVL